MNFPKNDKNSYWTGDLAAIVLHRITWTIVVALCASYRIRFWSGPIHSKRQSIRSYFPLWQVAPENRSSGVLYLRSIWQKCCNENEINTISTNHVECIWFPYSAMNSNGVHVEKSASGIHFLFIGVSSVIGKMETTNESAGKPDLFSANDLVNWWTAPLARP